MNKNGILLIGLGPHARRIYFPLLEKYATAYGLSIPLVVDLESQREIIEAYLEKRALQPQKLLFLEDRNRHENNGRILNQQLTPEILAQCHGIIISSEAQTHEAYINWALNNHLDILTDKPIIAPAHVATNMDAAQAIFDNYLQLEKNLRHSKTNFIVQCQRRSHEGYNLIHSYLNEFVQQFQIPISYIDIYHADGMWPMPTELLSRENHPYKYGYGKLMHSGYHFLDLYMWLTNLNEQLITKAANCADLFVQRFSPFDFLHQINQIDYERLFDTAELASERFAANGHHVKQFGELDAFIQCQCKRDNHVVTTGSIHLQQNSFSRRAWTNEPKDVYKGNGRIRHERVNIQVGNLLNIQVHSYQSHEVGKMDTELPIGEAGHEAHFDIHIYRNSGVVGGEPYQKFAVGKTAWEKNQLDPTYLGHNEHAREQLFLDFLNGRSSPSHFLTHKKTNLFLAHVYKCIVQAHHNQIPFTTFKLQP